MGRSAQRSLGPVTARHLQGLQVRSYQSSSSSELLRGYGLVAGVFASRACRRTNPQNSHDSAKCWAVWRSGCQAGVLVFKKYLLHLLLRDCIHKTYIPKGVLRQFIQIYFLMMFSVQKSRRRRWTPPSACSGPPVPQTSLI